MKKLLLTKILPSEHINKYSSSIEIEQIKVISIDYIHFDFSKINYDLPFVFTSSNSVKSLLKNNFKFNRIKKAYLFGIKTEELLSKYNIKTVKSKIENANSVADIIIDDKVNEINFVCGNIRRDELINKLNKNDIKINEFVNYNTKLEYPIVDSDKYNAIAFFSPSGVESYFKNNCYNPKIDYFAIGNTTKFELLFYGIQKVICPPKPNSNSLLECIYDHYIDE